MDIRDLADKEAERIENDESLTDEERSRYMRELRNELDVELHQEMYEDERR